MNNPNDRLNQDGKVLTVQKCIELFEMGVDMSNASLSYRFTDDESEGAIGFEYKLCIGYNPNLDDCIPALTIHDIFEILPKSCSLIIDFNSQIIKYEDLLNEHTFEFYWEDNILDALFWILKWCKQNNYV